MKKTLRITSSSILRQFNKKHQLSDKNKINLKVFDGFFKLINNSHYSPQKTIEEHYAEQLYLLNLLQTALGSFVLMSLKSTPRGVEDKNIILKKGFYDIHLRSFISDVCNTSSAIITLIKQGYDTQSRILARTLDERIYQCLILFTSIEDYEVWRKAESNEDAKNAHYNLFSKKNRLLKKVRELDRKYLKDDDNDNETQLWRKESGDYYSLAVHGSSASVIVGSFSFSFDGTQARPNIFGCPSSASKGVLKHVIYQLTHFLALLQRILYDEHKWVPDISNDLDKLCMASYEVATKASIIWLLEAYGEES